SDPDDQKFLELALESGASALVTKDKALLKLNRKTHKLGLFTILTPSDWCEIQVQARSCRESRKTPNCVITAKAHCCPEKSKRLHANSCNTCL
ncbi:MAG TPA: hypothetical protein VFG67_07525, partial [Oleiagrimonas sp.]|nr:hypothetical protein [Oleiagrimonas sp.]